MELLLNISAFGVVCALAALSPGPDLLVVTKNSLLHSRAIGAYTSLGVAAGVLVHVSYSVVGIGFLISQSVVLFSIIKLVGAAYLIYLGVKLLASGKSDASTPLVHDGGETAPLAALREGFLTNALNPKASLFFVSVFSQFFAPATPVYQQLLYGVEAAVIVGLWFVALSFMLTHTAVRVRFERWQNVVMKCMGVALIALGLKVAFTR